MKKVKLSGAEVNKLIETIIKAKGYYPRNMNSLLSKAHDKALAEKEAKIKLKKSLK